MQLTKLHRVMVKNTHLKYISKHKTYIYLKRLEIPTDNF